LTPWGKTTDKVGARVIVETKGDVARAVEAIRASDLEISGRIDDKRLSDEPTALVYPGTHFQVRVPALTEKDGSPIECEVQVRTKAEDLWSVPSHKLTYRAPVEVSRLTQRRMWRLSVLVEMFDEEVETAMAEVASLPGYKSARLLDIAESVYLTFVVEREDRELSIDVITALGDVVLPPQSQRLPRTAAFVWRLAPRQA
jgi:putative GTP pyrophosphokinase